MTAGHWAGQAAVLARLAPGTEVTAVDEMLAPLITLHPKIRFLPSRPRVALVPAAGGVIVRAGPARPQPDAGARLAIAATNAGAAALGSALWGTGGFQVSDGRRIRPASRHGGVLPDADRPSDPVAPGDGLTCLQAAMGALGTVGALANGDSVLWLDAMRCLRSLSEGMARQIAWRGRIDTALLPQMRLTVPRGRVRLEFERIRSRPRLEVAGICQVHWTDERTVEIETDIDCERGRGRPGALDLRVHAPRARLARVGIVVATGPGAGAPVWPDPLARYADPLAMAHP